MTRLAVTIASIGLFAAGAPTFGGASAQTLDTFGILAGSTITSTGATIVHGNVGLSPGSAITGFPPGIVTAPYTIYSTDAIASQAKSDLVTAYNIYANRPTTQDLTGVDLGGQLLAPGVYSFSESAQLTGTLTLDAGGDPNAVFIFNIGSSLTTASASAVALTNGAQGANVFFVVGSSAILGSTTDFSGTIMALTSISFGDGATIDCGAALARNGAVTLIANTITVPGAPEASVDCAFAAVPDDAFESELDSSATNNEVAVAAAIDDFIANGGTLPLSFAALLLLSPEELADALAQLSGQAATGVAPSGTQAMDSFLSLLGSRFDDTFGPAGNDAAPADDTVRALGYGEEDSSSTSGAAIDQLAAASSNPRQLSMWVAGYGGHNHTAGDVLVGSSDRSSGNFGLAAGLDIRATPDTRFGIAFSTGVTDSRLADGMGGGHGDVMQAGIYGRTNLGAAYLAAAFAVAWHEVSTDRTVTVAGTDRFTAEFSAHDLAGAIEAGYRFRWLTPYAALRVQSFHTPAYNESVAMGVSTFALDYAARTTSTVRSELGARINPTVMLDSGATLVLRAGAAWAHDYGPNPSITAEFQLMPGSRFTVRGAAPERDALLLSAGAEVRSANGISIAGAVDTVLAQNTQTFAGSGRLRYAW